MALRSLPATWFPRRSNSLAARQLVTFDAEASPGEWIKLCEEGEDKAFPLTWKRVSGLTASEAMDLLAWLESSPYLSRQISYRTGAGFAVRFQ